MSPIAGRVQRRRSFGQMLADDSGITDLLVTERKLIMRKANGARIVRQFGMLQRAGMEGDGARLLTARIGDAAMQSPQGGEQRITNRLTQRVGWTSKSSRSLCEIILEQPCFSERRANGDFVLSRQRAGTQHRRKELNCVGAAATLERRLGTRQDAMNRDRCHGQEYTKYAARQLCNFRVFWRDLV